MRSTNRSYSHVSAHKANGRVKPAATTQLEHMRLSVRNPPVVENTHTHTHSSTSAIQLRWLGFARRCRGACRAGGGQLSSVRGGPTSVFVLLRGKMAEAAAVPPHRFFCHCCKGEVNPKLPVRRRHFSVRPSRALVQIARLTSQPF